MNKKTAGKTAEPGSIPRYQEIAADLARKLAQGEYAEGDKIYARSALASQYGVSAETARRAVCVLADLGVVEASKGSGVTILSIDKAVEFLQHYSDHTSLVDLKMELVESVNRQKQELDAFSHILEELVVKTKKYTAANPFTPFKITVEAGCPKLGRSLGEMNFWHYTGATVIAVGRGENTILSPGPYIALKEGDVVFYIGEIDSVERVHSLLDAR